MESYSSKSDGVGFLGGGILPAVLAAVVFGFSLSAIGMEPKKDWIVKVVAKESGLPVEDATVIIYPGGKEKGPDHRFEFITGSRGRAAIPLIEYEKAAVNDLANIIVEYDGERRAHVFCGPETLLGEQPSDFVIPLSASKRVSADSKFTMQLAVTDFRKKRKGEFWQLRVSGRVPGVAPEASEWWWYLEPIKAEDGQWTFRGDIPLGLLDAKLHLDSRFGTALMYQDADEHISSKAAIDLGTIEQGFRAGRVSFYEGASVVVRVLDPEGNVVNDAQVGGLIRSAVVPEYYGSFRPLRRGTEGKYVSPPMLNLAVAAIRVTHPVFAEATFETKASQRGERQEVDIQLTTVKAAKQADGNEKSPSDFIARRLQMLTVRPGKPRSETWPLGTFGKTHSGLRAALILDPMKSEYAIGETAKRKFLVENVSDRPIQFSTLTFVQHGFGEAHDSDGNEIKLQGAWYTGVAPQAHYLLAPGGSVEIRATDVGFGDRDFEHPVGDVVRAEAGKHCTMRFHVKLPGVQSSDGDGRVDVPARGEWIGALTTGWVDFQIVEAKAEATE